MDAAGQEANLVRTTVGLRTRDDLVLVNVCGDDRRDWLNGQLTNDVRAVTFEDSVYALAVTVRGKIMADVWVLARDERLAVVLPRSAADSVLESFERQIIMEDVTLEPVPQARLVSVQGPLSAEALAECGLERHRADELGSGGWLAVFEHDAAFAQGWPQLVTSAQQRGGGPIDEAGFELARVRAARPRFGRDFWDQHYPQEAGLIGRAVSFNKGCYLGQEVVCTLENRGRTSRRLTALRASGAPALERGARLCDAGGNELGQLTTVCVDAEQGVTLCLGYLKSAAAVAGNQLRCGGVELEVQALVGDS